MELGREAGFMEAREIYVDPSGLYGLYRYELRALSPLLVLSGHAEEPD
jgi:hypothetical protein